MHTNHEKVKRLSLLGILLAFTIVIGLAERMIMLDGIAPGMRLGLANLAIVISLYTFPPRDTLLLIVLKCLTTALLAGSMIALFYSLAGSLASLLVMVLLIKVKNLSIIGVSVAGAAFHNLGQILVARFIFGTWGILLYLPLLLIAGTISGIIIGLLAKAVRPRISAFIKATY
ncbi:MAG: Gx transporter family protein [Lachnospiraceae bacterium]|nr:Gx transporter family protein [Lachnospiraceae bacterium]